MILERNLKIETMREKKRREKKSNRYVKMRKYENRRTEENCENIKKKCREIKAVKTRSYQKNENIWTDQKCETIKNVEKAILRIYCDRQFSALACFLSSSWVAMLRAVDLALALRLTDKDDDDADGVVLTPQTVLALMRTLEGTKANPYIDIKRGVGYKEGKQGGRRVVILQ